jgi:hypothetical protein
MFGLTKTVTIPSFTRGIQHLYPLVISNGGRYYAEPVMVYTDPMYNATWTLGAVLGTVNGVEVRCNDNGDNQSSDNAYQCTEFCNRYYQQVYGKNIVNTGTNGGNANTWFAAASAKGLEAFQINNSLINGEPRPGDILWKL